MVSATSSEHLVGTLRISVCGVHLTHMCTTKWITWKCHTMFLLSQELFLIRYHPFLNVRDHGSTQNPFLIKFLWFRPEQPFFCTCKYGAQTIFNCFYESFKSDVMPTPTSLLIYLTIWKRNLKDGKLPLWREVLHWCEEWQLKQSPQEKLKWNVCTWPLFATEKR